MDAISASRYLTAIEDRHSVRQYKEEPLAPHIIAALRSLVEDINASSGLRFQLVVDEPQAFSGFIAHYGTFRGVRNYVALVGEKGADLEERCGYYGEKLVLEMQALGLNTCWVALTYKRIPDAFSVLPGEKLVAVIAFGEGLTQGSSRKSKDSSAVSLYEGSAPEWFERGVEAALLAPTAINQQKFKFSGVGDRVSARAGLGPCAKIDLGIVKFHFECGAAPHRFEWV